EWVHVQLHQQKGMISLSPPTICNSAKKRLFKSAGLPGLVSLYGHGYRVKNIDGIAGVGG
ncbi:hypothetical protein R9K23_00200, partial [Escherichia coli]